MDFGADRQVSKIFFPTHCVLVPKAAMEKSTNWLLGLQPRGSGDKAFMCHSPVSCGKRPDWEPTGSQEIYTPLPSFMVVFKSILFICPCLSAGMSV